MKFTGCTVHIVDSGIDTGTILDQEIVKVSKNDSTESLKKKILKKEHYLYIKVIKKLENILKMSKIDSKTHENFYSKFIKITIVSCILVTLLLALLWFFLIL